MKQTIVAFIMSVYKNDSKTDFKAALDSIRQQSHGFESIRIYLGIDGTLNNDLKQYIDSNKDLFYKIISNDTNIGLARTLNVLIDELEGEEYIFRMDSDDLCLKTRVSVQLALMDKNKDLEIVGGGIQEIDINGNLEMKRFFPKSSKEARQYIHKASPFAHPTVCFRRSFFAKGYRYPVADFPEDIALWFRALSDNIQVSNVSDVVLLYRKTPAFYNRRGRAWAWREFKTFTKGIIRLHGFSYKLIFPVFRIVSRIIPSRLIKKMYASYIRSLLNNV